MNMYDISYVNVFGEIYIPHKNKEGKFVVSMSRFKKDYVYVDTYEEVVEYLRKGFSLRMSAIGKPPSLISSKKIKIQEE